MRRCLGGGTRATKGLDLREGKAVDSVTPMVIVLMLSDGKAFEHRDYADSAPFLEAVREVRAGG